MFQQGLSSSSLGILGPQAEAADGEAFQAQYVVSDRCSLPELMPGTADGGAPRHASQHVVLLRLLTHTPMLWRWEIHAMVAKASEHPFHLSRC